MQDNFSSWKSPSKKSSDDGEKDQMKSQVNFFYVEVLLRNRKEINYTQRMAIHSNKKHVKKSLKTLVKIYRQRLVFCLNVLSANFKICIWEIFFYFICWLIIAVKVERKMISVLGYGNLISTKGCVTNNFNKNYDLFYS